MRRLFAFALLATLFSTCPATAEVHFGSNVFIGGHNFSHQAFDRRHRLHVTLYDHPIRGAGCVTRGSVRTCRLQRIRH